MGSVKMPILDELPKCNDCSTDLILLDYVPNNFEKWFCSKCRTFSNKITTHIQILEFPIKYIEHTEKVKDV